MRTRTLACRRVLFGFLAFLSLLLLSFAPEPALAQQPSAPEDDPWYGVEEMTVTGAAGLSLFKGQSISVTAFDSQEIDDLGISDIADVGQFTPNLEIRTAGSTTPILFIRGVGLNDFTANASGSVAVYMDDVALNLPGFQGAQLFDIENIDVLKGPQGSGPGRNASAGAIHATSVKPTGDVSAFLNTSYGNFGFVQVEGAVGVPILDDRIAGRVSFQFEQRDGLVRNRCAGFSQAEIDAGVVCGETPGVDISPSLDDEFNDVHRWALRGQIRFQPELPIESDWVFNIHGSRVDQQPNVGQPVGAANGAFSAFTNNGFIIPEIQAERSVLLADAFIREGVPNVPPFQCRRIPGCTEARNRATLSTNQILSERLAQNRPLDSKPFVGNYNLGGHERQETWGSSIRGELEFDSLTVTTITGVEQYDRSRIFDADYTASRIFEFDIRDDAWQATQDVRLEQELEIIPLTWKAGAYALAERLDVDQITIGGGDTTGVIQRYDQLTWAVGAWGEVEWTFADDFELKAGIRYNWESKLFDISDITSQRIADGENNRCAASGTRAAQDCKDETVNSAPTGGVSLTYHFNEEVSSYIKYSRGWKGVQYNASDGISRGTFTVADPETIDAVEVGFSGSWFEGRLDVSGAFFYYQYEDYQVFIFANDFNSPPIRVVRNASSAQLYGAEIDAEIEPIERLVLGMRFGWLESKFLDFADSNIREIIVGAGSNIRRIITQVPIDYTGNQLPNAPRFKVSASAEYTFNLGRFGSLRPRYDLVFTDSFSFDPSKDGRGAPDNNGRFFLPKFAVGQDAYILHNARLSYLTAEDKIELSFWVRNFTDKVYKSLAFDASSTAGLTANLVGDPRTYGMTLNLTF